MQMTSKECLDHFQQDLNDPTSTLIAIEEHNTQINISIGGTGNSKHLSATCPFPHGIE